MGITGGELEEHYNRLNPSAVDRLVSEARDVSFTHVISPPSRYPFSGKYAAALANDRNVIDLTSCIAASIRTPGATAGATAEALLASWTVSRVPPLPAGTTVLVVDDVVSSGRTMAALAALVRGSDPNTPIQLVGLAALWVGRRRGGSADDAAFAPRES